MTLFDPFLPLFYPFLTTPWPLFRAICLLFPRFDDTKIDHFLTTFLHKIYHFFCHFFPLFLKNGDVFFFGKNLKNCLRFFKKTEITVLPLSNAKIGDFGEGPFLTQKKGKTH